MDVLMPPNDKQMNIWFDSLNIHRFAISGQDFKIIDAFNGWKIIPIFSKYVIKKDKSKKIEGQEFMSFGLFPPKKIFIDSNFGEIFEI